MRIVADLHPAKSHDRHGDAGPSKWSCACVAVRFGKNFFCRETTPAAALNEISNRTLSSLDTLTDKGGVSEFFDQDALQEMETFWKGVRQKVEKIAEIRNRG